MILESIVSVSVIVFFLSSALMVPFLLYYLKKTWKTGHKFTPSKTYIALDVICDVSFWVFMSSLVLYVITSP